MDTKTSDALAYNKYLETFKAAIMEVEANSKVVPDHETPLIMFTSLFVPAIAIVLIRDWYESYTNSVQHRNLNVHQSFQTYFISSVVAICLLANYYTVEGVFDNIMYIVPANSMGWFLISDWGTQHKFRIVILFGDLGIRIGFISIAVMSLCNGSPISLVWYNICLIAFVVGTLMKLSGWIVMSNI